MNKEDLTLNFMAVGSLPHKNVEEAMKIVNAFDIPFYPQLARLNKNEDMTVQYLENMPGLVFENEKIYLENESDEFFEQLENFFVDYEEIISDFNSINLGKYAISEKYSSTFNAYLEIIKEKKPKYAKGQIVGPFTLATTLTDKEGKCAYYDETLREIIVKTLSLKALWQIKKIKDANKETTPIIFIDEPSISQLGTSAFITIPSKEVEEIFMEVSELIKNAGGLSGIHCCGKCDWSIPLQSKINIINLDGYFFAQNLSLFSSDIKPFLEQGGIIAWGIIPTLDKDALEQSDINKMVEKFEEATEYLVQKGINKDLIIRQSMITPSCGAGSLTIELAQKAMKLTKELSLRLKEKYRT